MDLPGKAKRDTNTIGEISEAAIITRFLQLGYVVLTPYGGNERYDLVIEDDKGCLRRVQCKTARLAENDSVIVFATTIHNVTGKNRQPRNYRGECDYFAAFCERLNKVYVIPVDKLGAALARLRLEPPKNNQIKQVLWAKDYEL